MSFKIPTRVNTPFLYAGREMELAEVHSHSAITWQRYAAEDYRLMRIMILHDDPKAAIKFQLTAAYAQERARQHLAFLLHYSSGGTIATDPEEF